MLVVIVPLAFAAVSFAGVPSFSITKGHVTSLTPTELTVQTVQAQGQVPTSCTRASSSPAFTGFKVGDLVTIDASSGRSPGSRASWSALPRGSAVLSACSLPSRG